MRFQLDKAEQVLSRTPSVLRALLAGLDPLWTHANYGPGTWSPFQVVGHLIFGEMTDWIPRARIIREHGAARPFDPFDRNGHEALIKGRTMPDLLDEFERRRAESMATLRSWRLTVRDLASPGVHPALGPVTLGNLLATWVVHDLNHLHQIAKAMAFQYKPDVGPWEAYMSILAPPAPR